MEAGAENEDVRKALEGMGLEREEAEVYRLLIARGVSTVGDISQFLDFSRTKVYGIFDRLLSKGWVRKVSEAPRMFAPVDPEKVLRSKRRAVTEAYRTALEALQPMYESLPGRVSEVAVLRGSEALQKVEEMIRSAKREVKVVATVGPLPVVKRVARLLIDRRSEGLDVMAVVPPSIVPDLLDGLEARISEVPDAGLVIVDGNQVYVGGIDPTGGDVADMVGIWTENSAIVTFNNVLFDSYYSCRDGRGETK
ncbi:MAG: hypothetical protein L0Z54_02575 [Thermoplasmata archaeon]|nr:hypothetical protein [Thermoplasmata archaeon]